MLCCGDAWPRARRLGARAGTQLHGDGRARRTDPTSLVGMPGLTDVLLVFLVFFPPSFPRPPFPLTRVYNTAYDDASN